MSISILCARQVTGYCVIFLHVYVTMFSFFYFVAGLADSLSLSPSLCDHAFFCVYGIHPCLGFLILLFMHVMVMVMVSLVFL